jgi:hypothetical protein
MGTEIGVGMLLRPAVENLGERGGLSTARWEILLEHEHEYDVAFRGEVRDGLGHDRPAFPPGNRRHLRVFTCPKTGLGDMDCVVTVGVAQEHRSSYGEPPLRESLYRSVALMSYATL